MGLREKVIELEDRIAHEWKVKARALTERVKKQAAKLDGMDALKMEKAAMRKQMEKMYVVSMEQDFVCLKERVKDMVDCNAKLKKSVKEY